MCTVSLSKNQCPDKKLLLCVEQGRGRKENVTKRILIISYIILGFFQSRSSGETEGLLLPKRVESSTRDTHEWVAFLNLMKDFCYC